MKNNTLTRAELKQIAVSIRRYRDEKCYTQEYMANQLGISQSGYQKIETGANNISLERLIQIAEILNKSVDVLIGNKENDKNNIFIQVSGEEYILMKRIISQQEKLIKELRGKLGIWDEV